MTGILVLCRYSSSRLRGKILKEIDHKPILQYILERLGRLNLQWPVVVCTSEEPSDNPIVSFCKDNGVDYFRGDLENVALRFMDCARGFGLKNAVRINGDNIFLDSGLIESMILEHQAGGYKFSSNVLQRTFPKGMSVEIVDVEHYLENYPHFTPEDMEHVMTYFYRQQSASYYFRFNSLNYGKTLNFAIDTQEDFNVAVRIVELMEHDHTTYDMEKIIELYRKVNGEK